MPKDRQCDALVTTLDILPTSLAAIEATVPTSCDGANLLPIALNETERLSRDHLCWRIDGGKGYALRQGQWKLATGPKFSKPVLYDLNADIGETTDVSADKPGLRAKLMQKLRAWDALNVPPAFQ